VSTLSAQDRQLWADQGFFRINGFVDPTMGREMLDRVIELVRLASGGADIAPALVLPEQQPSLAKGGLPELEASKVFRVADAEPFRSFSLRDGVTAVAAELIGASDIDCFLSQFIFKNPGAWGQPWHQDSYYFPFDPPRPVVGVWLAVTEATLENGCLHVLPGSNSEPVHEHQPDRRVGANYGYVELVDHDMDGCEPVLMEPGDLLVFDSHLMHRSTDNVSAGLRAAMVFHFAAAGTVDRTEELRGYTVNDWLPVRRNGGLPGGTLSP